MTDSTPILNLMTVRLNFGEFQDYGLFEVPIQYLQRQLNLNEASPAMKAKIREYLEHPFTKASLKGGV